MNTALMHQALAGSLAGQLTFPQVIGILTEAGVESYRVDFITGSDVFYLPDGRTHTEPMPRAFANVAATFSANDLKATIRAAQADAVRYPEFVQRSIAAGVTSYHVYLTGRRAIYFGRKGEIHIEEFPTAS